MNNLTLAPEVAIVAEISEETEKERHITEYIRSLKTIEDAMEPYKDQKRDLRAEYDEQGCLSKDEQKMAIRAWRMVQKEECIHELTDYFERISKYLKR